jgi:hypothetical protein
MDKKERFQQAKQNVLKRFPNATTVADSQGKFYVASNGVDICNRELNKAVNRGANLDELDLIREIKHSDSVFEAWLKTESMIVAQRVIESNTERFSDEKIAAKNLSSE